TSMSKATVPRRSSARSPASSRCSRRNTSTARGDVQHCCTGFAIFRGHFRHGSAAPSPPPCGEVEKCEAFFRVGGRPIRLHCPHPTCSLRCARRPPRKGEVKQVRKYFWRAVTRPFVRHQTRAFAPVLAAGFCLDTTVGIWVKW